MALLSAPRSVELWVQWGALSQRHRRPLITDTTITGITATTVTDNTRVTTDGDITVLTAAKPSGAPRRLRQTRPRRGTEVQHVPDARVALRKVLGNAPTIIRDCPK